VCDEIFGPILFLYTYKHCDQLKLYFGDSNAKYMGNKMYVSLFGTSEYIESRNDVDFIKKKSSAKGGIGIVLHDKIIHDITVDNGTVDYGGYSKGASSVICKDENGKFTSVAIPLLALKVIYRIFIEKVHIKDLVVVRKIELELKKEILEKQNRHKTRREISIEFINLIKETFGNNVVFAFIFGSISHGTFQYNKSDMDTFICVREKEEKVKHFISEIGAIHRKFNLKIDNNYPSEIVEYTTLVEEMYHLYYQLYGINYNPWLDNEKYDCSFLTQFKCLESRVYDIVFWSAIIATGKRIPLVEKDRKPLLESQKDAQKLIGNIIEEILKNIENTITTDLPQTLKEKYSDYSSKEVADELRKLNYCEILQLAVKWPEEEMLQNVKNTATADLYSGLSSPKETKSNDVNVPTEISDVKINDYSQKIR
jgi:hypothetical protein